MVTLLSAVEYRKSWTAYTNCHLFIISKIGWIPSKLKERLHIQQGYCFQLIISAVVKLQAYSFINAVAGKLLETRTSRKESKYLNIFKKHVPFTLWKLPQNYIMHAYENKLSLSVSVRNRKADTRLFTGITLTQKCMPQAHNSLCFHLLSNGDTVELSVCLFIRSLYLLSLCLRKDISLGFSNQKSQKPFQISEVSMSIT
jgi:hypothetical protein